GFLAQCRRGRREVLFTATRCSLFLVPCSLLPLRGVHYRFAVFDPLRGVPRSLFQVLRSSFTATRRSWFFVLCCRFAAFVRSFRFAAFFDLGYRYVVFVAATRRSFRYAAFFVLPKHWFLKHR